MAMTKAGRKIVSVRSYKRTKVSQLKRTVTVSPHKRSTPITRKAGSRKQ